MSLSTGIPSSVYGVLQEDCFATALEDAAEQVRRLGYAIVDSGLSVTELREISDEFDSARSAYIEFWGEDRLRSLDELYTVRAPLTHGGTALLDLAMNSHLMTILGILIEGKFILNQQNGVINPSNSKYNQGAWHRDLPYQHYTSSSPLAVNALFCLDDFTLDNGSTFVLPSSHKAGAFPSKSYVTRNALQVEAKAGQFILLDCMLFHSGGFNRTNKARRAINHVYTIPYFKQQISFPENICAENLNDEMREILGFNYREPTSIDDYFSSRERKNNT